MTGETSPQRRPMPGDAVRIVGRPFSIAKVGAIGVIQGALGVYPHDGASAICFGAYSTFRGRSSKYATGHEFVSSSGGPMTIATPLDRLRPTEETISLVVWRWADMPRANGGEDYRVTVPVWEWEPESE